MGSRVFLSPETELFFVKTHIIHALAETTSEAYGQLTVEWVGPESGKSQHPPLAEQITASYPFRLLVVCRMTQMTEHKNWGLHVTVTS